MFIANWGWDVRQNCPHMVALRRPDQHLIGQEKRFLEEMFFGKHGVLCHRESPEHCGICDNFFFLLNLSFLQDISCCKCCTCLSLQNPNNSCFQVTGSEDPGVLGCDSLTVRDQTTDCSLTTNSLVKHTHEIPTIFFLARHSLNR